VSDVVYCLDTLAMQLMQLAVEGPRVSDVCDAKLEELAQFSAFLETAYRLWLAKSRRGL